MDTEELSYAIEALLFAQAEPMDFAAIRQALRRALPEDALPEDASAESAVADDASTEGASTDDALIEAALSDDTLSAGAAEHAAEEALAATAPKGASTEDGLPAADNQLAGEAGAADLFTEDEAADAHLSAGQGGQDAARAPGDHPSGIVLAPGVTLDAEDPTLAEALEPFALTSPVVHRPKPPPLTVQIRRALELLQARWRDPHGRRGFGLVEVGGGWTFRTHLRFGEMLRAVREAKPQRLSRPAMEALAIVAYRQPVTKPDVDHLRGVDSGGSLKVLLDRKLVAVVGKKEEPGRPLLYGTTPDFLHFFNLRDLTYLPSLREFHELNEDDAETVRAFAGLPDIASLAQESKNFRADEVLATDEVEEALAALQRTQCATRAALLAQGVTLADDDAVTGATPPPVAGEVPTHH